MLRQQLRRYTLRTYFGDSDIEAELAEDGLDDENIKSKIWTFPHYATNDDEIRLHVQKLERRKGRAKFRKILEILDEHDTPISKR